MTATGTMNGAAESPEQALYRITRLLDTRKFDAWLDCWTEDLEYTVTTASSAERNFALAVIQDDRARLVRRIQIMEKLWHAEDPPTRTTHIITNLEAEQIAEGSVVCHSCFIVSATRRDRQFSWLGRYRDTLVFVDGCWKLRSRLAILDSDLFEGTISFII